MRFSAAIFDLDGTLCDTIGDLQTSMNEMLRTVGLPEVSRDTVISSINNGAREFVRGCLPKEVQHDEDKLDRCLSVYRECYSRHYLETTYAYAGMPELVADLRAAGFRLGVLSNKQDVMVKKIIYKLFGDDAFDDYAVWGQAFLPHKPDPAAAYYVAGVLHVKPDETAFIGDSHIDIGTALNAGMFPVGVSWGYRPAELLVETGAKAICNTPDELGKLLLGI